MNSMTDPHPSAASFRAARDLLLRHRDDYAAARREFSWPALEEFNWALDWFDVIAAEHPDRPALRIVADGDAAASLSYGELAARSSQVANWLSELGARRGDRLLLMLGNIAPLWEVILAAMKLGVVIIPASTLLGTADLADRITRGDVRHVVTEAGLAARFDGLGGRWTAIAVGPGPDSGATPDGWLPYADAADESPAFTPDGVTRATGPLLLYFTSGTTAQPKLVEHTHASYPAGHLSTMYWIGLQPGDVHMTVASPGWAKQAWSCVFAPWIAGATICVYNYERFDARSLLDVVRDTEVTTFCAPPTVWRMIVQQDLTSWQMSLRELVSAGEPLNPEVIEQVRQAWGLTIRDGFGQTETTLQIGNSPGQPTRLGSMGRPMPGFRIALVDPLSEAIADEGEICVECEPERPIGLMVGYQGDHERNAAAFAGHRYHTGDVATRDEDGFITYVGRTDDVFKASDYRISPFELESVLIEHPAVAEAAVVPAPDELRLAVPKAFVVLVSGYEPSPALAGDILRHCREKLAPYKRIRRLQFTDLPKTISGKIRRVELRNQEAQRLGARPEGEYREEDFAR